MPTISARVIKKPKRSRVCDTPICQKWMQEGIPQVRLYGHACRSDPKCNAYICIKCAQGSTDPKIIRALNEFQAKE